MQIIVPKCGSVLLYRSRSCLISSSLVAYFRSTPISFEKWNNKWSANYKGPKPSKTYVKCLTRQKRANSKKALNDFLFRNGCSKFTLDGEFLNKQETISWDADPTYSTDTKNKSDPLKSYAHRANNTHQKRKKNKTKRGSFFEDFDDDEDDDPWTQFQAKFGNRSYSWSFKSWEESFSQSQTNRSYSRYNNKWTTASDDESGAVDDSYVVGSHSDRIALGLPINGPLKIEEVKSAFRISALKWHPDKHQGPSQAVAEEKFKVCVNAYKSLCNRFQRFSLLSGHCS